MNAAGHRVCSMPIGSQVPSGDRVAILLCTRDGARFLHAQLESLVGQSHTNWGIYASDDGSDDRTGAILAEFQARTGRQSIDIRSGPRRGFVANFLELVCARDVCGDYFAFCDQDDIWEPHKLSRAVAWLSQISPLVPALYCSRTHLIDEKGNSVGLSPLYARRPQFRNAIVQSIAGGNTMVFNAAARQLLVRAARGVDVPSHDWWLYILVTAVGGAVRYDRLPSVRYRVHGANAVGANRSLRARLARVVLLLEGRLKLWTDMHVAALQPLSSEFSPEGKRTLGRFVEARQGNVFRRTWSLCLCKVYRQRLSENIALYLALALRKA